MPLPKLSTWRPGDSGTLVFKEDDVSRLAMEFRQLREGIRSATLRDLESSSSTSSASAASASSASVSSGSDGTQLLDDFALEVYGVSAEFNILTGNTVEMVKSLSGLVEHMKAMEWREGHVGRQIAAEASLARGNQVAESIASLDLSSSSSAPSKRKRASSTSSPASDISGESPFGAKFLLTFFGYYLLHLVCSGQNSGDLVTLLMTVAGFHPDLVISRELQFPLEIKAALDTHNYARFFALRNEANPYQRKLLEEVVPRVRAAALKIMSKGYQKFPLDEFKDSLDFLSLTECLEYLKDTAHFPPERIDVKGDTIHFRQPPAPAPTPQPAQKRAKN